MQTALCLAPTKPPCGTRRSASSGRAPHLPHARSARNAGAVRIRGRSRAKGPRVGASPTYTANGELASKTDTATGEVTTYQYDALGSLLRVDLPDGRVIEYVVDGRGRRVAKKVDGVTTKRWLYRDQLNPVAELDGAGVLTWQYVYGSKPNVPDYAIRVSDGARYRVVSDQLGSVVLVVNVDDAGDVLFAGRYSAFGEQEVIAGDAAVLPFGFAGGRYDEETGLVRFGARDYDPGTGRWTGKDPILWAGEQMSLYVYVGSDPVNRIDPFGLQSQACEIGDCFTECMDDLGAGWAAGALGLSLVGGGSVPKLGRARTISKAMGGSLWTSVPSMLGKGTRALGRRLNPAANVAMAGAGGYLAGATLACTIECGF